MTIDGALSSTVDEVRDYAHRLGAARLVATMPTLDGEALIDYRPGDWLKITVGSPPSSGSKRFVLPPDWSGP